MWNVKRFILEANLEKGVKGWVWKRKMSIGQCKALILLRSKEKSFVICYTAYWPQLIIICYIFLNCKNELYIFHRIVISVIWEAERGELNVQGQFELQNGFKASLGNCICLSFQEVEYWYIKSGLIRLAYMIHTRESNKGCLHTQEAKKWGEFGLWYHKGIR